VKKFNCFPKHNFDFNIPTRKELLPLLDYLSDRIVDTVVPVEEMLSVMSAHIGTRFRVHVLAVSNIEVTPGDIDVNALYDQDLDEAGKIPIELILITNPTETSYLWNRANFNIVAKRIVDSIIHEMTHMHQARDRQFLEVGLEVKKYQTDKEEAQDYLGQPDEIDAYSHNIASELADANNIGDITYFLNQPTMIPLQISTNLWAYINTFDRNIQHPVIRKLLKKVYKRYQNLK
jgi:hypothetical protein